VAAANPPRVLALVVLPLVLLGVLAAGAGAAQERSKRAPRNLKAPRVAGQARVGHAFSASRGRWARHPARYRFSWRRCNAHGKNCRAIGGAHRRTYRLVTRDTGSRLRVVVTASNRYGSTPASSRATGVVAAGQGTPPPPPPPPPPPAGSGLHVSGNQLLDGNGNVVHLHGVNYSGTEYACIQGFGVFDGPSDDAMVTALTTWHGNVVHIGLNEDCILAINGVNPAYAGANYMNAIAAFVNRLHAHGIYAEVSLMWAAPGSQQALDHPPILDADHAPAALQAIGNAFKNDHDTFFGLQSEPHGISWACWKNGGASCSVGYTALGMQGALDAVRSTGATNPVTASGIDYANNLTQWLANKPFDSAGQLMAEAHIYGGNTCYTPSCLDSQVGPVAAQVPVVFGETGETYDGSSCAASNIASILGWADAHGVGYEAWTWDTWGNCSSLISDFDGTPANTYGTYVRNHYLAGP
jgi:endoglucanase